MALPTGWPAPQYSGRRSLRFFKKGTATANYPDNAYLFAEGANWSPPPALAPGPMNTLDAQVQATFPPTPAGNVVHAYSGTIMVRNTGAGVLTFSFDGEHDHGEVAAGTERIYRNRIEGGICIKGSGTFQVEAW